MVGLVGLNSTSLPQMSGLPQIPGNVPMLAQSPLQGQMAAAGGFQPAQAPQAQAPQGPSAQDMLASLQGQMAANAPRPGAAPQGVAPNSATPPAPAPASPTPAPAAPGAPPSYADLMHAYTQMRAAATNGAGNIGQTISNGVNSVVQHPIGSLMGLLGQHGVPPPAVLSPGVMGTQ